MTAGKWSVTRYEGKLWRVWDGDEDYHGTYSTWEEAMRCAQRGTPRTRQEAGMSPLTLANMTPAERQECVGRWCDNLVSTAKTPSPVVLACVQGERCWVLHTTLHGNWSCFPLDAVAPRLDLPRAWTPAGEPVDMDIETGHVDYGRIWYGSEIMGRTSLPDGTTVHRHVTDWEEA